MNLGFHIDSPCPCSGSFASVIHVPPPFEWFGCFVSSYTAAGPESDLVTIGVMTRYHPLGSLFTPKGFLSYFRYLFDMHLNWIFFAVFLCWPSALPLSNSTDLFIPSGPWELTVGQSRSGAVILVEEFFFLLKPFCPTVHTGTHPVDSFHFTVHTHTSTSNVIKCHLPTQKSISV